MRKAQCICRVTGFALTIQLKMQMCPGGPAALPCRAEELPGLYGFARTDIEILQMGIHHRCSIRKQKLHAAAIAGTLFCAEHGAALHRKDAGALGAGKVDALMECPFARKGVLPPAVSVRNAPLCGFQRKANGILRFRLCPCGEHQSDAKQCSQQDHRPEKG